MKLAQINYSYENRSLIQLNPFPIEKPQEPKNSLWLNANNLIRISCWIHTIIVTHNFEWIREWVWVLFILNTTRLCMCVCVFAINNSKTTASGPVECVHNWEMAAETIFDINCQVAGWAGCSKGGAWHRQWAAWRCAVINFRSSGQ